MAAANGIGEVIVGRDGLLSTPAVPLIRQRQAQAGFLLTASHNPGARTATSASSSPPPGAGTERITEAVYEASTRMTSYRIATLPDLDLGKAGTVRHGRCRSKSRTPRKPTAC